MRGFPKQDASLQIGQWWEISSDAQRWPPQHVKNQQQPAGY